MFSREAWGGQVRKILMPRLLTLKRKYIENMRLGTASFDVQTEEI